MRCSRVIGLPVLLGALALSPQSWGQSIAIAVSGADQALEQNIRSHLRIAEINCESEPDATLRRLPAIRQQITRASRALGYYQAQHTVNFEPVEDCWALNIEVVPGEALVIGNINIELASAEAEFEGYTANLPVTSGMQLNHAVYESIKSDLSARAIDQGYFNARFERSQLALDLASNQANIDIRFNPGTRFNFGDVEFTSLSALNEDFVRRYIEFDSGTPYSSSDLIALRGALSESLYFENVSVTPAFNRSANLTVPVAISLQPKPRRAYSIGTGVTTDIGPRIKFDYEDRYFNADGHRLSGETLFSLVQQQANMRYSIPLQKPATQSLDIAGGFLREDTDDFDSETFKLGTTYRFTNRSDWRQNYFLEYQNDKYELNNETEVSDLLYVGTSLSRAVADDALYPQAGWRLFGRVKTATEELLSPTNFIQLDLSGKYVKSIGPGRVLLKFESGFTLVDDIDKLPVSLRYFTGGDQSVRGYKYQSLGPTNDANEAIGGKHFIAGGIEYDFNIAPQWKLALFTDVGNAFRDFDQIELKQSIGVGVRWLSPIGPIRVDLASALDDDKDFRLHITMGPDL